MAIEKSKVVEVLKGVIFFAKGDNIVDPVCWMTLKFKQKSVSD